MERSLHSRSFRTPCTFRHRCRQSPQRSIRFPSRSMWMIMYLSVSSTLVTVCAFNLSCFLRNVSMSTSILFLSVAVHHSPQKIRCIGDSNQPLHRQPAASKTLRLQLHFRDGNPFSFQAFAQEATIVGTATDPSGGAVPNVSITITNTQTNQVSRVTTNSEGQYLAPSLQIGRYSVRAEMAGFKKAEQTDLVLAVGDRARVDFKMEIGTAQESVTVEASPVAVQSESGEISDVITGTQISQLATNGRSLYSLAIMTAGAPDRKSVA